MKLIAQVKLNTTEEQFAALKNTLLAANKAANAISDYAWEHKIFRHYDLHKPLYQQIRKDFELSAQVTSHCLSKVSDAYKTGKKTKRIFKSLGSITFDARILSWKLNKKLISIWTIAGRMTIPFMSGDKQFEMLKHLRGEACLVLSDKIFYLLQVCDIQEPPEFDPKDFIGVDLGIVNIATTSDGKTFSGEEVDKVRQKATELRRALQKRGSKSAKRHLKKFSGKEARFKKNVNHIVSKKIVSIAKGTCRGIAIENLKGFNGRQTVSKAQRDRFGKWAFSQLRGFLTYKAKLAGVHLILVNPRNTSRICSVCGNVSKKNRKSQSIFSCIACRHSANADFNAAINISKIGSVNSRIAVHADAEILPFLELQTSDFNQR
jgi:IS605 OrfB family transposase